MIVMHDKVKGIIFDKITGRHVWQVKVVMHDSIFAQQGQFT